jgi:hypothetical protein
VTALGERPVATRRRLPWTLLLLPIGPLAVGLLRFLLPYYSATTSAATVAAVYARPGRETAVLWLDLVAVLTLVPGVLIALAHTRAGAPRLTAWAAALVVPAYLCLAGPLAADVLLWSGEHARLSQATTTDLVQAIHPALNVQLGIFIVGHVVGTVLLGAAVLRTRLAPARIAWALVFSQPLHFGAVVILGSPGLDLFGWSLTALGMGAVAVHLGRADVSAP